MIPLSECKHGYLYRIHSRNLTLGVFDETCKGFIGVREKFGHRYLFTEFHYDTGAPFGTVTPQELLEQCPSDIEVIEGKTDGSVHRENKALFNWLEEKSHYNI
jgi:hypothetical protein